MNSFAWPTVEGTDVADLAGKVIVVTGASRGIGAAVARQCVAAGARVIRVSRTSGPALGDAAVDVHCDLTDHDAVADAVRRILALGAPDALVNNAGVFLLASIADTTPEAFRTHLEVNLTGPFALLRAIVPHMKEGGQMVTVGSIVDYQVFPGNAAYAASKHGLRALHDVVKAEYAGRIRCSLISPGPTDTAAWDSIDPDRRADLPDRAAMLGPDDVADVIRFVLTRPPNVTIDLIRLGAAG